ncbi:MAG: pantoate--beta-alanine ligase [Gammaproteobacteria bacterium]
MSQLLRARSTSSVHEYLGGWRADKQSVALVPTMGNLHAGHLSLTNLAHRQADKVVCSVFVNPTQFATAEDLEDYPRTLEDDEAMLAEQGHVDLLFLPDMDAIYPFGTESAVLVRLPPLSEDLCGAARPGHFNGVASVVLRLLNLISPDVLVLGEKDYQQRILLERMVADLHLPIQIVAGAILREPDGLAMSSRNAYLTPEERRIAPRLHTSLEELAVALRQGQTGYAELEAAAVRGLTESGFNVDYVAVRRARDLAVPEVFAPEDERVVLAAAWLGRARLIDNVRV